MLIFKSKYKKKRIYVYPIIAITIGFIIRIFFISIYEVGSGSMEETLYKGDIALVNKFIFGTRLSQECGDLPLLDYVDNLFGLKKTMVNIKLPKFENINHGDIVVFNAPFNISTKLVKRCTGLPGDTFEIRHNNRYINGKLQREPKGVRYSYRLELDSGALSVDTLKKYGVNTYGHLWQEGNVEHYTLSKSEVSRLLNCSSIQQITMDDYPKGTNGPWLYPSDKYKYTRENFGPLVIPAKGLTIDLDTTNIDLYSTVIIDEEHNNLKIENNSIYINNIKATHYTFKKDYFIMMGDNRYQSYDSRHFGFVPESNIIGKVICKLFKLE